MEIPNYTGRMALIDNTAGDDLADMRKARGLSPEALALDLQRAAKTAPWGDRGAVNAHTIRRVERGHVPGPRVQFVLANYFGLRLDQVWRAGRAREVAAA